MYKTNERRFEYNINPQGPEEMQRFGNKYHTNTRLQDYTTSTATPVNKRGSVNYSMHEDRERSSIPAQQTSYHGILERHEPRGRINSETMIKRSTERAPTAQRIKNQYIEEPFKQTKKVYFGDEQGYKDYNSGNQRNEKNKPQNRGDQNRRYNGQQYGAYTLQENSNFTNTKQEKEFKPRKVETKQEQISDFGVNEKEIMEKIGRINRLNEEINNRLQRMLNKIDGA